jgi:hypothetical protein
VDALPHHQVITINKQFLNLVAIGMSAATLMLSTYNSVRISTMETQIIANNKKVDHLMDISNLHEQHFKAVDQKLDDVSDKLATILKINKIHIAKMTDFMEQKFGAAIAISKRLIHTAYNN